MGAEETKKIQDNESKADKFVRLGEYRVNKVIDAIGRLENLFNRTNYEYTQEQVEVMFSIMEKGFWKSKADLPQKRKKKIRFRLEEKQNREESQNEAVRKRNQCNKPEKHDEEVQNVWCHSIKADREITE